MSSPASGHGIPGTGEHRTEPHSGYMVAMRQKYYRIVKENPGRAGPLLKEIHRAHTSRTAAGQIGKDAPHFMAIFHTDIMSYSGLEYFGVRDWAALLSAGFDIALEEVIMDDALYSLHVVPMYLFMVLHALYKCTRTLLQVFEAGNECDPQLTSTIVRRTLSRVPDITSKLWQHQEFLKYSHDPSTDPSAVEVVAKDIGDYINVINELFRSLSQQKIESALASSYLYTIQHSHVPHLSLWLWAVEKDPMLNTHEGHQNILRFSNIYLPESDAEANSAIYSAVVGAIGLQDFAKKIRSELEPPVMLIPGRVLSALSLIAKCEKVTPVWEALLRVEIFLPVLALWRQLQSAERQGNKVLTPDEEAGVMILVGDILSYSCGTSVESEGGTPLQKIMKEHTKMLDLAVHALVHFPHATEEYHDYGVPEFHFSTVEILGVTYDSWARRQETPEPEHTQLKVQASVLRRNVQRIWYRVLQILRSGNAARAIGYWLELARTLDLDEATERATFQRDVQDKNLRNCDWRGCDMYVKLPLQPLKACKGCNRTFYCNRDCQMKHWKMGGHKSACKAIKDH